MPLEHSTVVLPEIPGGGWLLRVSLGLLIRRLVPMQTARCDGISDKYVNATCEGDLVGVGVDIFWDSMGPAFPVMLALIFLPASYITSGDLAIPLTIMVFIGAIVGVYLPPPFAFLGVFFVAIGVGLALFLPIHRLRRES